MSALVRSTARQRLVPDPAAWHEPFPLTEMQQAYYVGRVADGGAGAHIYLEFDAGSLNPSRMEWAWNRLVAETGMLRAVVLPDGRLQVQAEVAPYRLQTLDLTGCSEQHRTRALAGLRNELAHTAFDPHDWPTFAIRVAVLPGGRSRVCLAIDEMMVDGPSVSLLLQRWHRFYRDAPCAPPPEVAFRDYVLALPTTDGDPAVARALAYWHDKLAAITLVSGSPLACRAPSTGTQRRRLTLRLPPADWAHVKRHARRHRATPSALLLGLYGAALRCTAGVESPLPLLLTTYNRQPLHPDVHRVVGPFISSSIFLVPAEDGNFDDLIAAVQHQLWTDLEHGAVSAIRVLRERARQQPDQRLASVPVVFTSMLGSLVPADADEPDGWAGWVDTEASLTRTPGVFLEAIVHEQGGELRLFFDFAPAAVSEHLVAGALGALEHALAALAALPAGQSPASFDRLLHSPTRQRLPLTEVQSSYLVGRSSGDETKVYQEFLLHRHDLEHLERAWRRLVEHHPMLRAVVREDGTLSIADSVEFTLGRNDLTGQPDWEAALTEVRTRITATPMPLGQGPMFGLELSALPGGRLVLHATVDALIADARSLALVFHQLFRLHDGDESMLDAPAGGYPDYLRERVARAGSADAEQVADQWRAKFERLPPGPALGGTAGTPRVHRRFDLDGWSRLARQAAEIGLPPDVLVLTSYCDILREEFPGEPFTLVVVSWDRPSGLAEVVGDFTRLAWLVVDDELPLAFPDRAQAIWARVQEDLGRADVLEGIGPLRQQVIRSHGALRLPVVFTRVPSPDITAPPPGVELRHSQSQTAQVALDQVNMLLGDTLVCQWDMMLDALPGERLDALFERYRERLQALVGNVHDDPAWTLPPQLEAALVRHAGCEAVRFEGESLTYRELDRRSARLARYLQRLGCRTGEHIGVHMDRSAELVVALVAVLRMGAVYVPLDPVNPPERVRFLLADSGVRLVIADTLRCAVPEQADLQTVCPHRDRAGIEAELDGPLDSQVGPQDPVYMIYTSGTTGQPKGCRNSQRGLTNRLLWMQDTFPLTPRDRVAQKTPCGFDVSVWELCWPLLTGASVVLARPGGHVDPAYLARLLRTEGITVTHFVPSMLGMFLQHADAADCRELRYVFASGETLPAATAMRFFQVLPGAELHNLYGPTEAAIDVTHWACRRDWTEPSIPIGTPIANTQVYILDGHRRAVPSGSTGEIYLGGYGVALGYHRRPELDAERFVPSPFPDSQSPRLYRTGDLGRLGPGGVLHFLGRNDNQLKIRGVRVEAEEIEATLAAVPGVLEARVFALEDPEGGQALGALCVADGPGPGIATVREVLSATLPGYLVPSRIRFVERLPVTPNGKLDRAAAAELLGERRSAPAAPATAGEVAALAASLLGEASVGEDDDLFELGATSFTMIRLAQLVREHHGLEIPVEVLIERATPRGIAAGAAAGEVEVRAAPDLHLALDAKAKEEFKQRRIAVRVFGEEYTSVPLGQPDRAELFATSSFREFTGEPVSLKVLRELLGVFLEGEVDGRITRHYPSAGGLYPVQVYLYVKPGRVHGLLSGVYYVDPVAHALVALAPGAVIGARAQVRHNRGLTEGAAFGLFLVSTPGAIAPSYGDRLAQRYMTIEAGQLAQLAIQRSVPLGLGLCAVGEMDFQQVREHFALGEDQQLIVSLWGGGLLPAHRARYHRLGGSPENGLVAVVGFAAELPGIAAHDSIDGLAALLDSGETAIRAAPTDRWPRETLRTARAGAMVGAYLDDVTGFEAAEFGVGPREASAIDPQERLLLHCVRACLEDAAITPQRLAAAGAIGVFTGAMWQDYNFHGTDANQTYANQAGLAHRLSHAFDFTGPSFVLNAGCVSGLAAIDAACKAIRRGECTAAVAAAANLVLHPRHLDFLAAVGLLAEHTDSSAFTESASGWIVGEGVAAVLLKPLGAALADGDPIHAVLRGSAVRHSGTTRGYGLPSRSRQRDTMAAALADAAVAASAIDYVESAASGAPLADALEMRSLEDLFADRETPIPVGSVKPTLGHMEAASVFGQLAKVIAQFRHDQIFPTRMTGPPNPMISTRRVCPGQGMSWPGHTRRVLVNSFSGTGAYGCLVVEAPPVAVPQDSPETLVLPLSADTPELLALTARRLAERLERHPETPLAGVQASLRARPQRECRVAVVARSGEVVEALRELATRAHTEDALHPVADGGAVAALAQWLDGGTADWPATTASRVHLPPTPVRRDRYWLDDCALWEPVAVAELPAGKSPTAPNQALPLLTRLVAAQTGLDPVSLTGQADLVALGVESRQLLQLARRIEIEHGQRIPLEALYETTSLAQLATLIFGDGVPEHPEERNTPPEMSRLTRTDPVPLSPEQRGLLFLHYLDPEAALYHVPVALELHGPLDEPALARAFTELIRRHPLLATRIDHRNGAPVLAARTDRGPALETSELPDDDRHRAAVPVLCLEQGVARAVLLRCGPDRHRLTIVVHHLVFDGDSAVIVLEDLRALYGAQLGEDGPAGSTTDFADYVQARAEELASRGAEPWEFWRDCVRYLDGRMTLPFDDHAGAARTQATQSVPVAFGAERSAALREFARSQRVSLSAVLLSAYLLTVGRFQPDPDRPHSGKRRGVAVAVGTRQDPRFDRTVGYFVNMLPVPEPVQRDLRAGRYVQSVHSELTSALDHAVLPFPKIVELMPDVDPADGNPFSCTFAFQPGHASLQADWAGGLRAAVVDSVHQQGVGYSNLTLSERGGTIHGFLKYDIERFTRDTVETMVADLLAIADVLTTDPAEPVIPLVSALAPVRTPTSPISPGLQEARDAVRSVWVELLGVADPPDEAQFFESGGDSILAVQLVSRLRRKGLTLSVRAVYRHPVLADLARALAAGMAPVGSSAPSLPVPSPAASVPGHALTPAQAWFFERVSTGRRHWNQSVALELAQPTDPAHIRLALQAVVLAHPSLSCRFEEGTAGWRMIEQEPFIGYPARDVLEVVDLTDPDARDTVIATAQQSLDPFTGRTLRALHIRAGGSEQLVLMAHHLVVDGLSWRVVLDDLDEALTALAAGELPQIPAEHRRLSDWRARLAARAAEPGCADYWRAVTVFRRAGGPLLRSAPTGREGEARQAELTLDAARTSRLLGPVPAKLDMPVHDVLTGAVGLALARWRSCQQISFDVETHDRLGGDPDADFSRTVGWCTALDPVALDADGSMAPEHYLAAVRSALAAKREVPAGFLAYRYLTDAAESDEMPPALVSFNYLGQVDRLGSGDRFRLTGNPVPHERSPEAERLYPVEVYALVRAGVLRIGVCWSPSAPDGVDEHAGDALAGELLAVLTALTGEHAPDTGRWPLPPQQRGLVVDAMVHPDRYVEQFHWSWHGALDPSRLTRTWCILHRRHTVLRGRIEPGDEISLKICAEVDPGISWYPSTSDWAAARQAERARSVDLTQPPLLRLAVHGDGAEHRILLTFHHALLDGWSVALLMEQLYQTYLDDPDPATAVPAQPDAREVARWVAEVDAGAARNYWAERLGGPPPATRPGLPTPALGCAACTGRCTGALERLSAEAIRAWAARLAATESNVLQALWAALLWRCTGNPGPARVAFGVTLSGRGLPLPGIERMVGMFATSPPLVVEVRPDDSISALVTRCRDAALELSAFEWASTGQIHEWSGLPGHRPLFESLLVVENYPSSLGDLGERLAAAGIQVTQPRSDGAGTGYPLTLLIHRDEGGLATTLVFDKTRLTGQDADRSLRLWQDGLRRLAEPDAPGRTVAELVGGYPDEELPRVHDLPRRGSTGPASWPPGPERDVVSAAFRAVLGLRSVAPDDHFFDLGGHSLQAMQLLRELADRGAVGLRLDHLLTHPSAGALARFLQEGSSEQDTEPATSPLVPLRPGAGPAIYLLHPPGGQVACYAGLAARYPAAGNLIGIADPRADRPGAQPSRAVEELAIDYRALLPPEAGPLVLTGYSGGGVIAYELARQLAAQGTPPALVIIIDAAAPTGQLTGTDLEGSFLSQLERFQQDRVGGAGLADSTEQYLRELEAVASWTRSTGAGDPIALLRDTLAAVERYRPGAYRGPVALLRASETDFGRGSQFDVSERYYQRAGLGWEDHCQRLSVHTVPGNHITLLTDPNVEVLARTIAELVAEHAGVCSGQLAAPEWSLLRERARAHGLSPLAVLVAALDWTLTRWNLAGADSLLVSSPGSTALVTVRQSDPLRWRGLAGSAQPIEACLRTADQALPAAVPAVTVGYDADPAPAQRLRLAAADEAGGLALRWWSSGEHAEDVLAGLCAAHLRLLRLLAANQDAWQRIDVGWDPSFQLPEPLCARPFDTTGNLLDDPLCHAAESSPAAPAVICPHVTITHGELAASADQLGAHLAGLGAGPGDLIAVGLEKGPEQLVAVLGIHRCGAGYLPVDPSWPAARIEAVCRQAQLCHAIVPPGNEVSLPAGVMPIHLDEVGGPGPRPPRTTADQLAYTIFTSGSTGTPKGVAIEHRQARTTIDDITERFGIRPDDRVLSLSALSFDLSVYDIFGVLGAGGALVLPEPSGLHDPEHWLELIEKHQVTLWNTVPALVEMLVEFAAAEPRTASRALSSLRLVMLSGDWIPVTLPDRIRALVPGAALVSLGGATEASIWSICFPISEVDPRWCSIPYGRPLRGQFFYILDANGRPCPVGQQGELYISGHGLARGYLADTEQTAQRFAVHPVLGERLYRTGDFGRWRTDGTIEFLGRADRQVKVQGYRIELSEIESALGRLPQVRQAVVSAESAPDGRRLLVAHVVPSASGAVPDKQFAADVTTGLIEWLPEYMVPSRLVVLDALPLTAHGKIDHAALGSLRSAGMAQGLTAGHQPGDGRR